MAWFLLSLQLLGSLGVFLFGMKVMSEALQKVAGEGLKATLRQLTTNRVSGLLTGIMVTCLVQSSSATTVMVVSFVNAQLITLPQSIGVIMGANIGTTITGWIVAIFGFKVKMTEFALPAVGVGFALTFFPGAKAKQWGEVILGFGLLFLGLSLIKSSVPELDAQTLAWVEQYSHPGFLNTLLFVGLGTGLTVLLQSSSATMTLTLTLTAMGWIPYPMAVAMILGENVGTTATAIIAAIGTSAAAQRASRAHLLFNLIGVTWMLLLMHPVVLPMVDWLVPGDPNATITDNGGIITAHLAAFHTLFNVTNALLLLPFARQLATVVTKWISDTAPTTKVAQYVSTALVETPEMLIVQAGREMQRMTESAREMFAGAMHVLTHPDDELGSVVEDTLRHETLIDDLEREITAVLALTARAATSASLARRIGEMALNAHRIERVGDHCEKLVHIAIRNHKSIEGRIDERGIADIIELGTRVDDALAHLGQYLAGDGSKARAQDLEDIIDATRDRLRNGYLDRMRNNDMGVVQGLWLHDALHHLEEIGDRAFGIICKAEDVQNM